MVVNMKSMMEKIEEIAENQKEQDEVQAEILLQQAEIQASLSEIDEVQAELLLQGLGV